MYTIKAHNKKHWQKKSDKKYKTKKHHSQSVNPPSSFSTVDYREGQMACVSGEVPVILDEASDAVLQVPGIVTWIGSG